MKVGKLILNILYHKLLRKTKKEIKEVKNFNVYPSLLDIPYKDDGLFNHKFDVIKAVENRNNICYLNVHGGAYMFSTHRNNYYYATKFVERGFDAVLLDYLPNDGKRNTIDLIKDTLDNLLYVFEHKKELGLENDRFFIGGDSAGGHISLLCALIVNNKDLQEKFGYDFKDNKVEAIILSCPVYDYETIGEAMTKAAQKRMFGPLYFDQEQRKEISPRTYIDKLDIPTFICTAKKDFLRNESLTLHQDLLGRGFKHEFIDIDSNDKKIGHIYNVDFPDYPICLEVNNKIIEFLLQKLAK